MLLLPKISKMKILHNTHTLPHRHIHTHITFTNFHSRLRCLNTYMIICFFYFKRYFSGHPYLCRRSVFILNGILFHLPTWTFKNSCKIRTCAPPLKQKPSFDPKCFSQIDNEDTYIFGLMKPLSVNLSVNIFCCIIIYLAYINPLFRFPSNLYPTTFWYMGTYYVAIK